MQFDLNRAVAAAVLAAAAAPAARPSTGEVLSQTKITESQGGFTGVLNQNDHWGTSLTLLGDLDGDDVVDVAVGATNDDDGGFNRGTVTILFLDTDGTVKSHQMISSAEGGFTGTLSNQDQFGQSVGVVGDLDDDGVADLAVGCALGDDGGIARGEVWILFLNDDGTVKSHQRISDTEGGFTGILEDADWFGWSVAALGDRDGDAVEDLAVGSLQDDDGGLDSGALWLLFLNDDGTVKTHQKISETEGMFTGTLGDDVYFGSAVVSVGDLDGDGESDLIAGSMHDSDSGPHSGAVWVLFLDGSASPLCPWDCDGSDDGIVGVDDFLAVLAQWSMIGTSCDTGSGQPGVGVDEFLDVLAKWGLCPVN